MIGNQITIAVTGVGAPLGQSIVRAALASKREYRIVALDINDEDAAIFPNLPLESFSHLHGLITPSMSKKIIFIVINNEQTFLVSIIRPVLLFPKYGTKVNHKRGSGFCQEV